MEENRDCAHSVLLSVCFVMVHTVPTFPVFLAMFPLEPLHLEVESFDGVIISSDIEYKLL